MDIKSQKRIINKLTNKLPKVNCLSGCSKCCGPVMFSEYEIQKLKDKGVLSTDQDRSDGKCIYLKDEKCSIYEYRPFVCKLYGAHKGLACTLIPESKDILSAEKGMNMFSQYINSSEKFYTPQGGEIGNPMAYIMEMTLKNL